MIDLIDPNLHWPIRLRLDPLYALFSSAVSGDVTALPAGYVLFCKVWFTLSCLLLVALRRPKTESFAATGIACVFLCLSVSNGAVWSLLHWFPTAILLIEVGRLRFEKNIPLAAGISFLGVLFWTIGAGPFAFIGCLALLPWLSLLPAALMAFNFFAGAALSILLLPVYEMPAYPDNARLAPIAPSTFWGSPLAGPEIVPSPLSYHAFEAQLADAFKFSAVFSAVVLAVLLLLTLKRGRRRKGELALAGAVSALTLYLLFDRLSGAALTILVSKIAFGLALAPFPLWILYAVLMGLVASVASRSDDATGRSFALAAGFCLTLVLPVSSELAGGTMTAEQHGKFFSDAVEEFFIEGGAGPALGESRSFSFLTWAKASASLKNEDADRAVDGNKKTRWSSGALQRGGEEFEVEFQSPRQCPIVRLRLGRWPGDFPRGLAIDGKTAVDKEFRPLVHFPLWQGPLRMTKEKLYYFGPQNVVEVALPQTEDLAALRLRQTSQDTFYFWSIAEIECASARKAVSQNAISSD